MLLIVKTPFVGHGFNMPAPGTRIEVPDDLARHLMSIGVADRYETKIDPVPPVIKKKEPSESSRPAPAPRKKTRKRSKKSATKSSS